MKKKSHPREHAAETAPADDAPLPGEAPEAEAAPGADPDPGPAAPEPEAPETGETPEAAPADDPAPSREELLRDQLLRLQADFDNYRKRVAREKQDWIALAAERLVADLLPVLDNFDLGLDNCAKSEASAAVAEGFRLIRDQLRGALAKAGATPVEPAPGDEFDPTVHEAITQMPSPDVPEGRVVARTRAGWRLGPKLLRAAQVVVSSGAPA